MIEQEKGFDFNFNKENPSKNCCLRSELEIEYVELNFNIKRGVYKRSFDFFSYYYVLGQVLFFFLMLWIILT